jgi:hypothetical protein
MVFEILLYLNPKYSTVETEVDKELLDTINYFNMMSYLQTLVHTHTHVLCPN